MNRYLLILACRQVLNTKLLDNLSTMFACFISQTRPKLLSMNQGGRFFDVSKRRLGGYHQQKAALIPAIKIAYFQRIVWYNDTVANPYIPSPSEYGWREEAGGFSPVMTTLDTAPEVILQLVKCGCT